MAPKRKLVVVKVPLGYKQEYKPITFGPMPQLYLDLIENKDKIKSELKDQLYEPKWDDSSVTQYPEVSTDDLNKASQNFKDEIQEFVSSPDDLVGLSFINSSMTRGRSKEDFTSSILRAGFERPHSEAISDRESPHGSFRSSYIPEQIPSSRNSPFVSSKRFTRVEEKEDQPQQQNKDDDIFFTPSTPKYDGYERRDERRDERSRDERRYEDDDEGNDDRYRRRRDRRERRYEQDESEDELSNLLASNSISENKPSQSVYSSLKARRYDRRGDDRREERTRDYRGDERRDDRRDERRDESREQQNAPPNRPMGLDDLNRGMANKTRVLNIPQTSKAEEERNTKRGWLLYQFERLKRMNPNCPVKIPEFSAYTEVEVLEREYNQFVRQLEIESNVVNYKQYLQVGFGVVEMLVRKFLNFDEIQGFAMEQMVRMNQYDKVLYELGEKHQHDPTKPGWPPEIKLMAIVLFNAATFVMMKMFITGAGNSVFQNVHMGGMSGMNQQQAPQQPQHSAHTQGTNSRKPMQGPDVNFDD